MDLDQAAHQLYEDGYAIIKNFLTDTEISALKERMHEIVETLNPREHQTVFSTTDQTRNDYFMNSGDRISFFFEEEALDKDAIRTVSSAYRRLFTPHPPTVIPGMSCNLLVDKHLSVNKIGHALHCLDPVFSKITQSDKVKALAKAVGFVDPVICQSMYIFKQPRIGGVVMPHQDSTFLNTSPKRLIGVWIPLEDATKDNGCLWFIPGSHRGGVDNDRYMVRCRQEGSQTDSTTFTSPPAAYDDSQFVPAEMKAGSVALIHGEVVHKSEPNRSANSRHAYTFHLFDSHLVEYSKLNWLQPTDAGTFTHLLAES